MKEPAGAPRVGVVSTGTANLRSVLSALHRVGAEPWVIESADDVARAERIVLPGVGSFPAGMHALHARGLVAALQAHFRAQRPLLGICLGFQLLLEQSDESEESEATDESTGSTKSTKSTGSEASEDSARRRGLGVIPGRLRRLRASTVPHIGWNRVEPDRSAILEPDGGAVLEASRGAILEPGHAYFAHSYALLDPPRGWSAAWTDHDGGFVAAVERGPVVGCQFHPELSGPWGQELLRRWVRCESSVTPC